MIRVGVKVTAQVWMPKHIPTRNASPCSIATASLNIRSTLRRFDGIVEPMDDRFYRHPVTTRNMARRQRSGRQGVADSRSLTRRDRSHALSTVDNMGVNNGAVAVIAASTICLSPVPMPVCQLSSSLSLVPSSSSPAHCFGSTLDVVRARHGVLPDVKQSLTLGYLTI